MAASKPKAKPSWNAQAKAYLESYKGRFKIPRTRDEVLKAGAINGYLSTGCRRLDLALGWGLPWGKIVYFHGPTSQGKTALAVDCGIQAQGMTIDGDYGTVVYYDLEGGYDPAYAERRGLNIDPKSGLFLMPPVDTAEEVFESAEKLITLLRNSYNPRKMLLFILDSIASASTDAEMEDKDKWHRKNTGHQAAVLSLCMRNFRPLLRGTNCIFLMINQDRDKIDMYAGRRGGPSISNPGGKSLKYYSSQVLEITGPSPLYKNSTDAKIGRRDPLHRALGLKMRVYVEKNRCFDPWRVATFPFYFRGGIDDDEATLWFLDDHSLIDKSGRGKCTIYLGDDEYTFSGLAGFKSLIADKKIKKKVIHLMEKEADHCPEQTDPDKEAKRMLADKDELEEDEEKSIGKKPQRKKPQRKADDDDDKIEVEGWGSGKDNNEDEESYEE